MPPSATMSEDRPLSSSPERKNPDDEVREILDELASSTYLNPMVEKFLQDPGQRDLFYEVFARQANLIKSRCQDFVDGQVTVYDKVLLELTENGNVFESVAAQEYFCEEFLGISKDGVPIVAERILSQNLVLKAILAQAAYPDGTYGEKYSAETKYGDKGLHRDEASPAAPKEDDVDVKTARLISVYEKAKSDFNTVPARDSMAKLDAARFLRDTAENTVMYFRDTRKSGQGGASSSSEMKELIVDLEATCKMAQASVVTLSGGRKRKFDKHDYQVPPRGSRGRNTYRGYSNHRGSANGGGEGRNIQVSRRATKRWKASEDVPRPNVEPFPQRPDNSRGRYSSGPQRAFGYTRAVDSYQPGSEAEAGSHAHPYHHHHQHYAEPSSSAGYGYERGSGAQQREEYEDTSSRYGHGYGQEEEQEQGQGYGYGYEYGHGYGFDAYGGGRQDQQRRY